MTSPALFLSTDRHAQFARALETGHATATALLHALRDEPALSEDDKDAALHRLCLAWIGRDADAAADAGEEIHRLFSGPAHSDLGKGNHAFTLALALDFGRDLWPESLLRRLADLTASAARDITDTTPGNPHIVTNNWYMITHGGCLMACLAAHGLEGEDGEIDLADLEAWALGRFRAFCTHFGDQGLYHEGTGYIGYTLSILMPALVALRNARGLDLTEEFPNLRLSIRSMLTAATLVPARADGTPAEHLTLDWNDAGRGAARLNPLIPGLAVSRPEDQPALLDVFDRTRGARGLNDWDCKYRGLPLAVALYPLDLQPVDADSRLPRHLLDTRQGLCFWRDAWGDGRETIFGWYARCTHASPGHAHDDAGSIRLISNGRSWICGAGQARTKSIWQSVITHAREEDRPTPYPHAYPFAYDLGDTHGKAGIELRKVLGCYAERYLSWRTDLGSPVCLAVLDLVDDHRDPPPPYTWNLSFPNDLTSEIDPDGRGFSLTDPECGTLRGRFLLDAPDTLSIASMPDSTRTYSSGRKESYPGDHFVQARFEHRKRLRILVALHLAPAGAPAPDIRWDNPDIVFDHTRWTRPFEGLILKTVDLEHDRPNLQLAPAGGD